MLERLRQLLGANSPETGDPVAGEAQLRVATAALLVEMSRADFADDRRERDEIVRVLQQHFALDLGAAEALLERASERADDAVSLHEFTALLHAELSESEKQRVIELLWRVALADAELDRHEDYLVRKVADLLYVPHADLVRLKHRVLGELDSGDS